MRWLPAACMVLLAACGPPALPALSKVGTVSGPVRAPVVGTAWAFLSRVSGTAPAVGPSIPQFATAVPAPRIATGDARYVFGAVEADPYELGGLLDLQDNFDPNVDVLAQASAGDRLATSLRLDVQPGRDTEAPLDCAQLVQREPPAFRLEGATGAVPLDPHLAVENPLVLIADDVGVFDSRRGGFAFGLLDADRDGRPDDAEGDGIPDVSLRLFLRWRPRPGPLQPGEEVIAALVPDLVDVLQELEGQLGRVAVRQRLTAYVLPRAQLVRLQGGALSVSDYGRLPTGRYELVALGEHQAFWRLPNDLAARVPSQAASVFLNQSP